VTPLPVKDDDNDITLLLEPVIVIACGTVTSENKHDRSFLLHGCQDLSGDDTSDDILIVCRPQLDPKWKEDTLTRLPKPGLTVSFIGTLLHIDKYSVPDTNHTLQSPVFALRSITYI